MASRELSLKGTELGVQQALKRTPLSSPAKVDGDANINEHVVFRPSNILETQVENSAFPTASLLVPLKPRSSQVLECVKVLPPATNAPFGPTILDKLITKNKLQSMKEAELRKDKANLNEVIAPTMQENSKAPVDPQVLKKRKMMANRQRNPFVTKRRKRFKKKLNQQGEPVKQDGSKVQKNRMAGNTSSPNANKKAVNLKETKLEPRSASNQLRRRLNSESSPSSPQKKTLLNKSNRSLKSQSKMSNVEALKQSSKLGRNNRYSTRSDSPVLRNGKRRKCDELALDIYDIDKKKKRLVNDLASVKSDGMSDEQCSFVTASESDICSFLDLETNSQNLDVHDIKEESSDSTDFKLEVPMSPSNDGDDVNSNLLNLEEPFKGITMSSPKTVMEEEERIVEEKMKDLLDTVDFKANIISDTMKVDSSLKSPIDSVKEEKKDVHFGEEKNGDVSHSSLDFEGEKIESLVLKKDEESDDEEHVFNNTNEQQAENVLTALDSSNETILLEDSSVSESSTCVSVSSSGKNDTTPFTNLLPVVPQGRKVRSASLNDGSKVEKVSFLKRTIQMTDDEEHKTSDSEEVSFTADNSQFELFVERQYKRGRKKRSSSDTSLKRLQELNVEADITSKRVPPIPEDEKSSDANGPFSDEKDDFYEKYMTEESNSEEASCSSSQVSEHPKINEKEFMALQGLGCKNDKSDLNEDKLSENKAEEQGISDALSNSGENEGPPGVSSDTTDVLAMKESILSALGLQSASMQANAPKVKSTDKYTGTLKAVIKLNRNADKKSPAGRMVFKQKDTSNAAASKNLEYRICSGFAPGSENVPLTHLKDIAVNSISKKALAKPKSHFDLSGPLNEVDLEVAQVQKDEANSDGSAPKEEEVKKALIIPEKSSSFSIHPERLCSDVCSYCHGKFGSLDTPCHIGQIKNSERRSKILSIEILLTKDSCLCDACFRYVDRRANCPSFKAQAPKPQRRQPLTDAVCSVQGCGEQANHSVRRKWIVKLKKSIAKKLMIDMEKIQHNQHLPFPLCSQHYYWVDYFTVCGICKKRLSRNNMYALGAEAEELNQFLHEDGIPVHLTDKLFLCKLCRYYSSLRLKYKDLSLMTPGHKTYFRSYRRKILQYHEIEVSESEEDVGGKSAEDESGENHNQGKVKRRKSKKNALDESKKPTDSDEKLRQPQSTCTQGYSFVESLESNQSEAVAPTIDYSALGETGGMGFNKIASLLGGREQPEISGNQARIQVKFGNLNIGKLANLNIGQDARTDSHSRVQRPAYLPGEQDLPLKADISFQSRNKNSAWERCTSTIQFDKDTKQLWQELQRPYGNASSFLRHLVMLEKHWRSGSLVLTENADPRAVKYVNSVRNRVDSFERDFKSPCQVSSKASGSSSPAPRLDTPASRSGTPAPRSGTPASSSGTSVPSSETPAPRLDTPAPRSGTPAPRWDMPAMRSDTPVPVSAPLKVAESRSINASESLSKPIDSSDNISDKLENKNKSLVNKAPQVPPVSSAALSEPKPCSVTITSAGIGAYSTTASVNVSSVNSNSVLIQSLNSQPTNIPIVNVVNLNTSTNSSFSLSRSSNSSPHVSYSNLNTSASSSPNVSLILPPQMSTTLPNSIQNTLINFTSDRNSISLNQFSVSAPDISISPKPNVKSNVSPTVNIAPKPNPNARSQFPSKANSGAISKLLTGNRSLVSSVNNVSNSNFQLRKNVLNTVLPMDPPYSNKSIRKMNPNQLGPRHVTKLPPQLLRFPGPYGKTNVPPLELIVPKSFTMQTKTIPASSAAGQQPGGSKPRAPAITQGIADNLALLRQFRSLKPKPPEQKQPMIPASTSFTPMICDVRSLASADANHKSMSSSGSMPKIPKALTITQVSQSSGFPRSVTLSLEKKPNQIPAAFLGGEKPSVSVFCEVNPPP